MTPTPKKVYTQEELFLFHTPKNLSAFWKKHSLQRMKKINRDLVNIVDGTEGSGKSLWTIQQFYNLEPSAFETPEKFVSRIAFTPDEFFDLVRTVKNGVIIFDEAFRGFSSRAALSKVNRKLVQALMEMRQNNNIVFIILPSFFLLDIYPAMLRSNFLFNIYFLKNSGKRMWRCFNKKDKNIVYQVGIKKGWIYPRGTPFKGYFYGKFPGGEKYEEAYLKKKETALREMDKVIDKKEIEGKFKQQRDKMIRVLHKQGIPTRQIAEIVGEEGIALLKSAVAHVVKPKYVEN